MAVSFCQNLYPPLFYFPSLPKPSSSFSSSSFKSSRTNKLCAASASSEMELHNQARSKYLQFPFVSIPHRDLMVDVVSTVENRLDSQLLPCTLPPDVQHCQNDSGSAQASLYIRSGSQFSVVDFILGSWLHCELPSGGALDITSLSAYLNLSTDAPNLVLELIQTSPTSLLFILDLPPRKDLVLYPDYLQTFYENSQLETRRLMLQSLPDAQLYVSPSLYLRSLLSPTAIMIRVETDTRDRVEEIIREHLSPVVKEVVGFWLENCACGLEREVNIQEEEKAYLKKRDELVRKKTIEIDLGSNFPRLFGPELSDRVLGAIRSVYNM